MKSSVALSNLVLVSIKWGKETLKDVDVDVSDDALTFKSQVYALTSVPVDKQKLMVKGKQVKV
jgi:ubiquitin carboxyl-terminal hydrolase 14